MNPGLAAVALMASLISNMAASNAEGLDCPPLGEAKPPLGPEATAPIGAPAEDEAGVGAAEDVVDAAAAAILMPEDTRSKILSLVSAWQTGGEKEGGPPIFYIYPICGAVQYRW